MPRKKKPGVITTMRKLVRAIKPYEVEVEVPPKKSFLVTEGDVEPELDAIASVWIQRYKDHPELHFTEDERPNIKLGIGGGRAFQSFLNQKRVPYIVQDPIFHWEEHTVPYDFIIPKPDGGALRLEIKTFDLRDYHFATSAERWNRIKEKYGRPDYVIELRKLHAKVEPPTLDRWIGKKLPTVKVKNVEIALPPDATSAVVHEIVGWLTGEEVEEKRAEKGEVKWSIQGACYWRNWDELHDWRELEPKILECAIKVKT